MSTKENVLQIFKAAVAAVQPAQLLPAHLYVKDGRLHILDRQFSLNELPGIYVIGGGKASAAMAEVAEGILGERITAGMVVIKYGHAVALQKMVCREAAHPVPDEAGVAATAETIQLLQRAGANDVIICLISGGASSLWIDVPYGATLADVQQTFQLLLKSGASIDEVNTIRKHLSAIKGGQLVSYAPHANWFCFIISDVPDDELEIIASGPTVADSSTFATAKAILDKYGLTAQLPASIRQHINDGVAGVIKETPKENDEVFKKVHNRIIGSISIALKGAEAKAKVLGYYVALIDEKLRGDAATVGRELVDYCKKYNGKLPACLLLGGEPTVTVKGKGKGGRNQQLALSALEEMAALYEEGLPQQITLLSAGTDGTDGPTDAAGAMADNLILSAAQEKNLHISKYLRENDAWHFFEQTDGLVITGPTQTNVMDLVVVIIED